MIKYLGSKRLLVPAILEIITGLDRVRSVIDLFSGTSRVGHALKRSGFRVIANDHNAYAATNGVLAPSVGYGVGTASAASPDGTNVRRAQVSLRFTF